MSKMPLCQDVHTQQPGTPGHAHDKAQGQDPLSLARRHERRGSLVPRSDEQSHLWDPATLQSSPALTQTPLSPPHSLPSHIPCTSLLPTLALAAQALPAAERVSLHFILLSVFFCHSSV